MKGYFDKITNSCLPCENNCLTCEPLNPKLCLSCERYLRILLHKQCIDCSDYENDYEDCRALTYELKIVDSKIKIIEEVGIYEDGIEVNRYNWNFFN